LRDTALAAAGVTAAGCFPDVGGRWARQRGECAVPASAPALTLPGVVSEVHDEASVEVDASTKVARIVTARVPPMVRDALRLLGGDDWWAALLPDYAPGMRIGLKVNCLNPQCATSVVVARAVVDSLVADLGVPASDVVVWDRRLDELTRSGFDAASMGGAQVLGTVNSTDDPGGPGYEQDYCEVVAGKTTRFSRILTEKTDVTINLPVLKTHGISGVTAAMKNIYGVIDNPEDFHEDLNDSLPALYALAPVRRSFRLTVVDGLIAVTVGGTSSPPDAVPRRVLAAADPVALDSYALALVNGIRAAKPSPMAEVDAKYLRWLDASADRGLGARAYALSAVSR
jgi:uncharacterized protein (DUF362 family)